MDKSSFVALSLAILVVSSCLCPVIQGKPAQPVPNLCCRLNLAQCCETRREKAVDLKATILGELHDPRSEVEHPKARPNEEHTPAIDSDLQTLQNIQKFN